MSERKHWYLTTTEPRRMAVLCVSPELLVALAGQTRSPRVLVTDHPLPDDTRYIATRWNEWRQCIELLLESEAFSLVPAGGEAPVLESPRFQVIDEDLS